MTLIVRNTAGETVQLEEAAFARGGEATVHTVLGFPGVVVKLYHPEILRKRRATLRDKIDAMASDPLLAKFKQHPGLAWPRFSVFDEQGHWRGYAMRRVNGVRMAVLAHVMAYREHFPDLDRPALAGYLLNMLGTLRQLHAAGVMLGDYNPSNFLCQPGSNVVTLIDCDSWQVTTTDKTFHCPVAAPDMLPPELLGKELGKVKRTKESEQFSLAILLFKVMMLGRHPFDVIGGESPVANIRRGHFPYGLGGGGIPKGPWFNIWSHLPHALKAQLVRTFREGARNPAERTVIADWIDLLDRYRREMDRGWHDTQLKPATPKSRQYRGTQSISLPIAH